MDKGITMAQALAEILPEGDKEKQLLQGLLGSKERVVSEVRQGRLIEGSDTGRNRRGAEPPR